MEAAGDSGVALRAGLRELGRASGSGAAVSSVRARRIVYGGTALYVVIFVAAFVIVDKMTPYDLWKEVVEDKNVALAILVGAMALGISIIIAAAVHG